MLSVTNIKEMQWGISPYIYLRMANMKKTKRTSLAGCEEEGTCTLSDWNVN